ncbi:MAG TPA: PAS domain S-box protein [Desulfotomaculum sp.]|nr:MAG: Fis family transcriptional regulator [Desulfotomaculum sp. BICA1-6]HBX24265.1 PAS domain S-box protein [Desulfotomaculum sp.]
MAVKNSAARKHFALIDDNFIYNSMANLVIAIDNRACITIFNHTCERIFGILASDAIGKPIKEVVPYTGLIKVLKTGKAHIGRKVVFGNDLYIANRTPIIKNNQVVGAIGVAQEAIELHKQATELDETNRQKQALTSIFKHTREGYLSINKEGYINLINPAMVELLGVSSDNILGRHITEVIPETQLHLLQIDGTSQHNELVQLRNQNILISRFPVSNNGQVDGAVCRVICQDLDKLAAIAQRKNHAKQESRADGAHYRLDDIIGAGKTISQLKDMTRRVARGPSTVMITGESGTGKELFAHALHAHSSRCDGPFIKVNCAAVPENLLESELFGYREGAFTGARKGGQTGKFELAHKGTILLDEIGDMPMSMQAKLLRVLQEKEIEKLGDRAPKKIDVRVLAATNRNLTEMISEGKFRQDLYFRLNVINISIPPLRDRREDIPELANYFITHFNREFNLNIKRLDAEVAGLFEAYNWPGNVRELENIIERAFNLVESDKIELNNLPQYLIKQKETVRPMNNDKTLPVLLESVEKEALIEALEKTGGNKLRAAKALGISRAWLYKKIKQYQIGL